MGEYMLRPGSGPPQAGQSAARAAGIRTRRTMKIESRGGTRSKCLASQFLRSPSDILHFERSTAPFPLTLTLSLRERSPRTLYAPSTPEPGDVRRFLPLFPTQEGGEGW